MIPRLPMSGTSLSKSLPEIWTSRRLWKLVIAGTRICSPVVRLRWHLRFVWIWNCRNDCRTGFFAGSMRRTHHAKPPRRDSGARAKQDQGGDESLRAGCAEGRKLAALVESSRSAAVDMLYRGAVPPRDLFARQPEDACHLVAL